MGIRLLAAALAVKTAKSTIDAFTTSSAFNSPHHPIMPSVQTMHTRQKGSNFFQWRLGNNVATNEEESQRLLTILTSENEERSSTTITDCIANLEASFEDSNDSTVTNSSSSNNIERFNPLIDLYRVQYVQSSNNNNNNKKNNPVGGQWTRSNGFAQKIFRTRKSYQHLLPFNETGLSSSRIIDDNYSDTDGVIVAEAINVISLDALDGRIRASVLLRGDAMPLSSRELEQRNSNCNRTMTSTTRPTLSNLAVRACFDPPRIVLGIRRNKNGLYSYLPLKLGPTSDVVLDTTYYDDTVRIGMGGTSGTRFVFVRTKKDEEEDEANEYKALLALPLASKVKVMSRLGVIMATSMYIASGGIGLVNLWKRLSVFGSLVKPHRINLIGRIFKGNGASASVHLIMIGSIRILAGIASLLTGLLLLLISFSTGGIERDEMTS